MPDGTAHRALPDAMRAVLAEDGEPSIMVTTWVVVAEYMDETGATGMAAWASDDPPWRINGLLDAGAQMLDAALYDDEESAE